ncbi:nitrite reductase [Vibrio tapetis]|uniref:Uncharacterized protein n=1 Tax=Vibrio tapetis subsp. tapetis TaxID=1671868 RepID=A0A2N8ZIT8_9VIBR|nr:nitrite reductase [Vibrio tapetis]SON51823.1 conserved protein of unknown function [Vibrio tapetis subsp. tapetis]
MEALSEVLVVLIIFGAIFGKGLIRTYGEHKEKQSKLRFESGNQEWQKDKRVMQEQLNELTERVQVLEKIVTDPKHNLDREISSL